MSDIRNYGQPRGGSGDIRNYAGGALGKAQHGEPGVPDPAAKPAPARPAGEDAFEAWLDARWPLRDRLHPSWENARAAWRAATEQAEARLAALREALHLDNSEQANQDARLELAEYRGAWGGHDTQAETEAFDAGWEDGYYACWHRTRAVLADVDRAVADVAKEER